MQHPETNSSQDGPLGNLTAALTAALFCLVGVLEVGATKRRLRGR